MQHNLTLAITYQPEIYLPYYPESVIAHVFIRKYTSAKSESLSFKVFAPLSIVLGLFVNLRMLGETWKQQSSAGKHKPLIFISNEVQEVPVRSPIFIPNYCCMYLHFKCTVYWELVGDHRMFKKNVGLRHYRRPLSFENISKLSQSTRNQWHLFTNIWSPENGWSRACENFQYGYYYCWKHQTLYENSTLCVHSWTSMHV